MNKKTTSILHTPLTIILTGAFIFAATSFYFQNKESKNNLDEIKVEDQISENTKTTELQYFSDKLILQEVNNKFLLEVNLYRQEGQKEKFSHYYTASIYKNGNKKTIVANFNSNTDKIKSNEFISNYENKMFDDLSTRETYDFSLNIYGEKIDATLSELEGDFITKNDPAYTRYLSIGKGTVKINGEAFSVNAALEKVYSNDKSQYLFFPGINDLTSRTYRFLVWDTEGNFYLLDDSTVSKDDPHYRPHTWVLYKNASPKYLQKFFEADIDFKEEGEKKEWTIKIPGLETTLILSTTESTDANWTNGTVKGSAKTKEGNKELFGHFSYKKE